MPGLWPGIREATLACLRTGAFGRRLLRTAAPGRARDLRGGQKSPGGARPGNRGAGECGHLLQGAKQFRRDPAEEPVGGRYVRAEPGTRQPADFADDAIEDGSDVLRGARNDGGGHRRRIEGVADGELFRSRPAAGIGAGADRPVSTVAAWGPLVASRCQCASPLLLCWYTGNPLSERSPRPKDLR